MGFAAPATLLLLDGMLIYTDPRDGEVYRSKLMHSDGEEVVWFADNYRAQIHGQQRDSAR